MAKRTTKREERRARQKKNDRAGTGKDKMRMGRRGMLVVAGGWGNDFTTKPQLGEKSGKKKKKKKRIPDEKKRVSDN